MDTEFGERESLLSNVYSIYYLAFSMHKFSKDCFLFRIKYHRA